MIIGLNGYFLTRPYTGLGRYSRGLVKALDEQSTHDQLIIFVPEKVSLEWSGSAQVKVIPSISWLGASLQKFWWEQWQLPQAARKLKCNLIHHLYPATSFFIRLPQVTSIHDATPWHFPEHNYSAKIRYFRTFTRWASRRARAIITVSETARHDISQIFSIPLQRIYRIYNGLDDWFRHPVALADRQAILTKYQLTHPYIFYIGGFEIHKNVRGLVLAYADAAAEFKEDLVIAGGVFSKTRPPVYRDFFELPRWIKNHQLEGRVRMIGPVPDQDLPALFQAASLYVSPSLAEGFNLPMVEAFASNVPVVCADIPVNHEIGSEAAIFTDTTRPKTLARAMLLTLNDAKKRQELIKRGWVRQKQFSWDKAAQMVLKVYRRIGLHLHSRSG